MGFTPRTISPTVSNKYYRHTGYKIDNIDGVNECIVIDSTTGFVIPNCVGYTWGRWYEVSKVRPTLSRGDAQNWYGYSDGYQRLSASGIPKVGDIICFQGGSYGGHVGFIEKKLSNTMFITSNSWYNSLQFIMETVKYENGNWVRYRNDTGAKITGYTCQGFIVNPYVKKEMPIIYKTRLF